MDVGPGGTSGGARLALVVLVVSVWLPTALSPAAAEPVRSAEHVVDGRIDDWAGTSPMVAGQSVVSRGEFVYQDGVYDDAGADTGSAENHRSYRAQAEPDGDYLYPEEEERCRWNCADLLEFRTALVGDRVHFLVRLNTLLVGDSTVAAIALGPHGEAGEPHAWPRNANLATPGTAHVLTLWGTGGAFDDADLSSVGGEVAVDVEANAIEASVPASLVGTRFRAYVGTGLWDTQQQQWLAVQNQNSPTSPGGGSPEDPRAFNVAFRPDEIGFWYEEHQAAALGAGDIAALHADIDLTAADRAAPPLTPGQWYERIYQSQTTVPPGEGVSPNGIPGRGYYAVALGFPVPTLFHYLGTHQPYSLYVPTSGYERASLTNHPGLYPHGLNTLSPHYAGLAEAARAVMVTPLARGPIGFCTDYAHLDVLEAFDDALALFPHGPRAGEDTPGDFIDTDRTMLWGYSMGGLCTARLAVLHPDRFASAVQWAASTALNEDHEPVDSSLGHPANGNELDLLQNTRGVQWRVNHCSTDEVAYYNGAASHAQRLEELGYAYNFRTLFGCDHLLQEIPGTPAYADYAEDAVGTAEAVVEANPPRVTFTTEEGWWRPDISPRLVFDGAYWVSGLRTRVQRQDLTAYGTVDAVTHGLEGAVGFATAPYAPRTGVQQVYPYTEFGRARVEGEPVEPGNAFKASLTNLRAVSFDLGRMGLGGGEDLTATLSTDGATEVRLAGAAGRPLVSCDPAPCPAARDDGGDVVVGLLAAGEYVLVLGRQPVDDEPAAAVSRVNGETRLETAVNVSREAFESAEVAVLARVDDFPDALAGSALAAELDAPVLLTATDGVDPLVAEELDRLGVSEVYLLGGTAALSAQVERALDAAGIAATRVGGAERFATAALVADEVVRLDGPVGQAVIALGGGRTRADDWPDALAASNLAAAGRAPVLLVGPDEVPAPTAQALERLLGEGAPVFVAGGEDAVGAGAQRRLEEGGYRVTRLGGGDRYATAVAITQEAVRQGGDLDPAVLATGEVFADALVAGPAAAHLGGALLLVDPDDLSGSQATADYLSANAERIDAAILVGGQATISDHVADQVNAAIADKA